MPKLKVTDLLPPEWVEQPLDTLTSALHRGSSPNYVEHSNILAIGQRCVRENGFDGSFARPASIKTVKESSIVKQGDVLLNSTGTGTMGRSCIFEDEGLYFVDSHVTLIRPAEQMDSAWLNLLLQSSYGQQYLETHCYSGSTNQLELSRSQLAKTIISLPRFKEQKDIANIVSAITGAIAQTAQLITKLKLIKTGLLHDLLTRGLDEHGQLRDPVAHPEQFKDTALGRIPKEWDVIAFDRLAAIIDPQPDHRAPKEVLGGYPYVGVGDFNEDGSIDIYRCRKVSFNALHKQQQRFKISTNDILFGKIGTIGMPRRLLLEFPYALNANTVLIKPKDGKSYIFWILHSTYVEQQIKIQLHSTSQPAFGIQKIRALLVPMLSTQEIQQIVNLLDTHSQAIAAEESYLAKLKQLKKGLMDDLLTGKVRVRTNEDEHISGEHLVRIDA